MSAQNNSAADVGPNLASAPISAHVLRKNTIANVAGRLVVAATALLFVPVYISYLGLEAFGVIGFYTLMQTWLTLLDAGMTPTLNREMAGFAAGSRTLAETLRLLRSLEVAAAVLALSVIAILAATSAWIASTWFDASELSASSIQTSLTLMGVVLALRLVEGLYRGSLLGLELHIELNVALSIIAIVRSVGAVLVLALYSSTVEAFFAWQMVASVFSLVLLGVVSYRKLPSTTSGVRPSIAEIRRVGRFASGMFGITFLGLLLTQVDKVLLSKLLPLADYGVYVLAAAAAGSLYLLIAPITQARFPRLTRLHEADDADGFAETFHGGSRLVSVILCTAGICLAVFAELVLSLWTGDSVLAQEAATLLALLTVGNLLNGFSHMPYFSQLAHGWTSLNVKLAAVSVSIAIPAIFVAVRLYGPIGAASIWACVNLFYLLVGTRLMFRRIMQREEARWWRDLLSVILPALLVAAGLRILLPSTVEGRPQQALVLIVAALCIGAAAAAGAHKGRTGNLG